MSKSSSQIISRSLLMLAAIAIGLPSRLIAQQSIPVSAAQSLAQIAPDEPAESASLSSSAPELPTPMPSATSAAPALAFAPAVGVTPTTQTAAQHHFWDRENRILFAAAGGLAVADFCVTRANLATGGKELNPITRVLSGSTPGLAANFALETGGLISISYLLHKTGHHHLERMTSYVNIGSSAGAIVWGLSHR
jgi:hypothetical protein